MYLSFFYRKFIYYTEIYFRMHFSIYRILSFYKSLVEIFLDNANGNSNNLNRTLNNPICKINKNFNIFKWSSDLNGIDENILKHEKLIRESHKRTK
jgi:hypothetical protein